MIFCKFKRIIAGICIGFGAGILLILFLPPIAWFCIIGLILLCYGIKSLF